MIILYGIVYAGVRAVGVRAASTAVVQRAVAGNTVEQPDSVVGVEPFL